MRKLLNKNIDENEVKQYFKTIAKGNKYMLYNDESLISIDYKQTEESSIIDGQWIKVLDKNVLKIVLWYDNEFGYSCQVIRVVQKMAGIKYPLIPEDAEEMGF